MEEDKKEIVEEPTVKQNKVQEQEPRKTEENQIQEFYGEKKPNSSKKLIIIVTIVLIGLIISLIMLHKLPEDSYKKEENNNQENTNNIIIPNDEVTVSTSSDDILEENETEKIYTYELNLKPTLLKVDGKKEIYDIEKYINDRNIDYYTRYIENNEIIALEGILNEPGECNIAMSIKNGVLNIENCRNIYIINNIPNVKKAAGYFSAMDGITIYFITEDNKAYRISEDNSFSDLYKYDVKEAEDIILIEYMGHETSYLDFIIIKTKENKYYKEDFKELIELKENENMLETINLTPTIINTIKERQIEAKKDIDDFHIYSEKPDYEFIPKQFTNIERGRDYETILKNSELYVYFTNKIYKYNDIKIDKYTVINEYTYENEEEIRYRTSIFFVTKEKEIYRINFEKQELESFVKYNINNVEYILNNNEDEEKKAILVSAKDGDYMIDCKEDVIYKIKY